MVNYFSASQTKEGTVERVGCYDDPLPTFSLFLLATSAAFDSFPTLGNPVLGSQYMKVVIYN